MSRSMVELDWTAGATPEAGFPAVVVTGVPHITGVIVVQVRDVIEPSRVRYEAVQVAGWTSSGHLLTVSYLTGLEPGRRYIVTLEVLSA